MFRRRRKHNGRQRRESNVAALEATARREIAQGAFEDSKEDTPAILEEFYAEGSSVVTKGKRMSGVGPGSEAETGEKLTTPASPSAGLGQRLHDRARRGLATEANGTGVS